jgi:hypothetical protein
MQSLHHARAPEMSRLNNYLVWPSLNIIVLDMASLSLEDSLSKNVWP